MRKKQHSSTPTGCSTKRMAIANGSCVSFCNQPKAHFGLPWVHPWDNRSKCHNCHMDKEDSVLVKCIAACTHLSSTDNRFPVIQPVSSKVCHFSTFFAHFGLPWVCLWDNRGKCYRDERGFNAGQTHSSIIHIYLQPFASYSEILVGNCNFFLSPCI